MSLVPVLSTIPRSGTWFLRYAISFLFHLDRGGHIEDRLTGRIVGDRSGAPFDFARFGGGPLFQARGTLAANHLFIGHTVCPGFTELMKSPKPEVSCDWWSGTRFHVPGYDYFHEGHNYSHTPVDLAQHEYAPLAVQDQEREASRGRGQPIALVHRDPVDQAASFYAYAQGASDPVHSHLDHRPLRDTPFREYLLRSALPSYAKEFISFQVMAARYPKLVRLMPYEHLLKEPVAALSELLDHLAGEVRYRPRLADAVLLARREHLQAIERELGRSLVIGRTGSHMAARPSRVVDEELREEAFDTLRGMGIDTDLLAPRPRRTAAPSPMAPSPMAAGTVG
jgi:hypothetical protein